MRVENLFPELDRYQRSDDRRDYVEQRLIELATETRPPKLITLLHNQEEPARRLVVQVLFGIDVQNNQEVQNIPVPIELRNAKFWVESIDGKTPIEYKAGVKRAQTVFRGRGENRRGIQRYEAYMEAPCGKGATRGELDMPTAYRVLSYAGENCTAASSTRLREKHWKFREVEPPQAEDGPEQPTRRRRGAA